MNNTNVNRGARLAELGIIAIAVALFFFAALIHLKYNPVDSDETSYATALMCCGTDYTSIYGFRFHDMFFPAGNIQCYNFALPSYMLIPFFWICGVSLWTLKFMPIAVIGGSIVLLYYIVKYSFDAVTAGLTILLVASSSLFIDNARFALLTAEPLIGAFFIASIFFLVQYIRKRRPAYLFAAALLLGSGLSIKLTMVSYCFGLFMAGIIIYPRVVRRTFADKPLAIGTAYFFALGALLFIVYNITHGGDTLKLARFLLSSEKNCLGGNNHELVRHAGERFLHLQNMLLDRGWIISNAVGAKPEDWFGYVTFCLAAVATPPLLLMKRQYESVKKLFFIHILFAVVFITSFFSPGSWRQIHLAILFPYVQLGIALFFTTALRVAGGIPGRALRVATCAIVLIPLLVIGVARSENMVVYQSHYTEIMKESPGFDIAASQLLRYIQKNSRGEELFFDRNTLEYMRLLSWGRIDGYPWRCKNEKELFSSVNDHCERGKKAWVICAYTKMVFFHENFEAVIPVLQEDMRKAKRNMKLLTVISDTKNNVKLYAIYECN